MTQQKETASPTAARELKISRLLDAPRELVWEVWTHPEHIKNWWGPNGFTNTIFTMNMKAGGEWDFVMHGPDGVDYKNKSTYQEIVAPERIVFRHDSGPKFQTTITFKEEGKKTRLDWQMLFDTAEEKDQVVKVFKADIGLQQNIFKLEGYLRKVAAQQYMTLTKIIDAPADAVFKAWTDPVQLKKWWGPKNFTNPVCKVDIQPGGAMYIEMQAPDGNLFPMDGQYHEIVPSKKIVFTSAALDENGQRLFEILNTVTFTEENNKTKIVLEAHVSRIKEEGKKHIAGMEQGWTESLERMENLVEKF